MPADRKYCTPEFVFDKVFTQPYTVIYLACLIGTVSAGLLYFFVISKFFSYGGLALSFGILVITMTLIIKALSKSVRVYLDDKSIFMSNSIGGFTRILKKDIDGICCYDYEQQRKPTISITIQLKNGKNIHLNDSNLFERADDKKAEMLKQFFVAAKKRLDLTYIKKDRWRALQGLGANWYSPLPGNE